MQNLPNRTPSTWTRTAVEYAVMNTLGIHGFSDNQPGCGYSHHVCMVPSVRSVKDASDDYEFSDFNIIDDEDLFDVYVRKTLLRKGISLKFSSDVPNKAILSKDARRIANSSGSQPRHSACLAILEWFNISSVPEAVHQFESLHQFALSCKSNALPGGTQ